MMLGMWFLWISLLVLSVLGSGILFRFLTGRDSGHDTKRRNERALQVLRERYARGEIDREEFEERRQMLA